eukprot:3153158-Alexandrium_andersonii.AAC.1
MASERAAIALRGPGIASSQRVASPWVPSQSETNPSVPPMALQGPGLSSARGVAPGSFRTGTI